MKPNNDGFTTNQILALMVTMLVFFMAGFGTGVWYEKPKDVQQIAAPAKLLKDGTLQLANSGSAAKPEAVAAVAPGERLVSTATIHFSVKPVYIADTATSGKPAPPAASAPDACEPYIKDYINHLVCQGDVNESLSQNAQGGFDLTAKGGDGVAVITGSFAPGALDKAPSRHPWGIGLAAPFGLPGAGKGLSASYDFEKLPITVGVNALTVGGKQAELFTAVWHF